MGKLAVDSVINDTTEKGKLGKGIWVCLWVIFSFSFLFSFLFI